MKILDEYYPQECFSETIVIGSICTFSDSCKNYKKENKCHNPKIYEKRSCFTEKKQSLAKLAEPGNNWLFEKTWNSTSTGQGGSKISPRMHEVVE